MRSRKEPRPRISSRRRHALEAGFTLIEIMVVLVILGLLAAVVVPRIVGRTDEARKTTAKIEVQNIEQALHLFKLDNGFYPSTEQGLEALVTEPTIGQIPKRWRQGGYLPKVPNDPWGNPYIYLSPGRYGDYDLVSYGGDGEAGGEGNSADIESWNLED
jgi:general secretion pathway protein G